MAPAAGEKPDLHWPETRSMVRVHEAEINGKPGAVCIDDAGEVVFHSNNRSAVWFWVVQNDLEAVQLH